MSESAFVQFFQTFPHGYKAIVSAPAITSVFKAKQSKVEKGNSIIIIGLFALKAKAFPEALTTDLLADLTVPN